MRNYNNVTNEDNNYDKEINRETSKELFSTKMKYSKWWIRSKSIRNNPKLDEWCTELYYNSAKRAFLIDGVDRGLTSIEAVKHELIRNFEYLTYTEKQAVGMALCLILDEMGYIPTKTISVNNCLNFKNASLYVKV